MIVGVQVHATVAVWAARVHRVTGVGLGGVGGGVGGLEHGHACPPPLFEPTCAPSPSTNWAIQAGGIHDERLTTQAAPPCGRTQHRSDSNILLQTQKQDFYSNSKGWVTRTYSTKGYDCDTSINMALAGTRGRCPPCYVTKVRKASDDVTATGRFSIVRAKVAKFSAHIKTCFVDLDFGHQMKPERIFWTLTRAVAGSC